MSSDTQELKERILAQSKELSKYEKEYDIIENELLETEEKFDEMENEILENFKDKTTIAEIVSSINSQYEDLEKKVSEFENQFVNKKRDPNKIYEILKSIDDNLNEIIKRYSLQEKIDPLLKDLFLIEKDLNITFEPH